MLQAEIETPTATHKDDGQGSCRLNQVQSFALVGYRVNLDHHSSQRFLLDAIPAVQIRMNMSHSGNLFFTLNTETEDVQKTITYLRPTRPVAELKLQKSRRENELEVV